MTRHDQIQAAVSKSFLSEGPCRFDTLLQRVQRAFPDACATEVDAAAREWERGEVGRYVYALEPLPEAQTQAKASDGQLKLFEEEATK